MFHTNTREILNKNLNNIIEHDIHPNVKQLNLGLFTQNVKGASKFPLLGEYTPPSHIPYQDVATEYKVSKNVISNENPPTRRHDKPVLNTHRYGFTIDPTREQHLGNNDRFNLSGLTARMYGIPDLPDIKLESVLGNALHVNKKTGHFDKNVSIVEFQQMNARDEHTPPDLSEAEIKILEELKKKREQRRKETEEIIKGKNKSENSQKMGYQRPPVIGKVFLTGKEKEREWEETEYQKEFKERNKMEGEEEREGQRKEYENEKNKQRHEEFKAKSRKENSRKTQSFKENSRKENSRRENLREEEEEEGGEEEDEKNYDDEDLASFLKQIMTQIETVLLDVRKGIINGTFVTEDKENILNTLMSYPTEMLGDAINNLLEKETDEDVQEFFNEVIGKRNEAENSSKSFYYNDIYDGDIPVDEGERTPLFGKGSWKQVHNPGINSPLLQRRKTELKPKAGGGLAGGGNAESNMTELEEVYETDGGEVGNVNPLDPHLRFYSGDLASYNLLKQKINDYDGKNKTLQQEIIKILHAGGSLLHGNTVNKTTISEFFNKLDKPKK